MSLSLPTQVIHSLLFHGFFYIYRNKHVFVDHLSTTKILSTYGVRQPFHHFQTPKLTQASSRNQSQEAKAKQGQQALVAYKNSLFSNLPNTKAPSFLVCFSSIS
jgi:hypothetical protein